MAVLHRLVGDDASLLADWNFRLLLLASVSSPLGSVVVSPILSSLTGPFGVSEARIGLVMAAFTAPAIVLIPVVGVLSDRYGRRPVLALGLSTYGLAGLAIPLTTDFRVVLALRFLQGVGYTGVAPTLITAVGDLYVGDREAAAQGLRFTTVGLSMTAFPLVAGVLVAVAWQYPFALYAIAVPTALVVAWRFEEPTASDTAAADGGDADGTRPGDGEDEGGGESGDGDGGGGLRALGARLAEPRVLAVVVGRAVPSFLWFTFVTYNSIVIVRVLGGSPAAAGTVVAVASLSSSLASTQVGRLTAAFDTRRRPLLWSLALTAVGIASLGLAPSVPLVALGAVATGAGFGVVLTLYRSTITSLGGPSLRGGLVSAGESIGRAGSTAAPLVLGGVVAFSTDLVGFGAAVRSTLVATGLLGLAVGGVLVLAAGRSTVAG